MVKTFEHHPSMTLNYRRRKRTKRESTDMTEQIKPRWLWRPAHYLLQLKFASDDKRCGTLRMGSATAKRIEFTFLKPDLNSFSAWKHPHRHFTSSTLQFTFFAFLQQTAQNCKRQLKVMRLRPLSCPGDNFSVGGHRTNGQLTIIERIFD